MAKRTRVSILKLGVAIAALTLPALEAQAQSAPDRIGVAAAVRNHVTAQRETQERPLAVGSAIFLN
jgi:hypothetical protein